VKEKSLDEGGHRERGIRGLGEFRLASRRVALAAQGCNPRQELVRRRRRDVHRQLRVRPRLVEPIEP
jgi:hypothetical protein